MRSFSQRWFQSRRTLTIISVAVIASLVLTQFWPLASNASVASRPMPMPQGSAMSQNIALPPAPTDGSNGGLSITLSEGNETTQTVTALPAAPAQLLPISDTQAMIDRLPPLTGEEGDQQPFNYPPAILPPPRPETVISESFPPTTTAAPAPEVSSDKLEVLRYAPEGEIRMAPFLQVTFNQPMAPLTTLAELSAADVPVKITPELPGVWKWLGTKTLTFEYKGEYKGGEVDRFPMATTFTAEVPAGTKSATGSVLEKSVTWTFTTPPPTVYASHPNYGPQRRDTLMFVAFNQRIDPAAVLKTITVTAGGQQFDLRLAAQDEIVANSAVNGLALNTPEGRWLAFRAVKEFPTDATVNVNVGPGTPSAEGHDVTSAVQSFSFQTYAPLRIVRSSCGWGGDRCPPGSPFNIEFNNPLDADEFDPALFTVTPAIPGMQISNFGTTVQVSGATAGRSSYKVTVSGAVQDAFGQTLGADQTLTFRTGDSYPYLTGPSQALVTLDPAATKPVLAVYSVNYPQLRVRLYKVGVEEWPQWQQYMQNYWQEPHPEPPGKKVMDAKVDVKGVADQLTQTDIDLSNVLTNNRGHVIVIVTVPQPLFGRGDSTVVQTWVQSTNIGLDAFSDPSTLFAWATRLTDGSPLPDVTLQMVGTDQSAVTGADGTVTFELSPLPASLLVGTLGDDSALLPRNPWDYWGGSGWQKMPQTDELRWHVFDDRQMYRPGEEVHVKGWVRKIGAKQDSDVGLLDGGPVSISFQAMDAVGNTFANGVADVNDLGGFDLVFTVPVNSNLGYANLYLIANGVGGVVNTEQYHSFQIQEFRRPEFEVTAQPDGQGPYFLGDDALVSVSAQYYAGGALPNAETDWTVSASPSSYSPPNWDEFTFGTWVPWWRNFDYSYSARFVDGGDGSSGSSQEFSSKTDASGRHYLKMSFGAADEPRPYSVSAEATVMDVNRQAWSSSASLLVHPASLYVGLRSASTFVQRGDPLDVDVIVTDVDGNPMAERDVTVTSARLEWKFEKGDWQQVESDVQECAIKSAANPVQCTFTTELGGEYRITAQVRDDRERLNQSQFTRWVSGGETVPARSVELQEAQLIPDKESYQPGETAQILVIAPFMPAEGLLTIARNGFISNERFSMSEGTTTLRIPIKDEYTPNLNVQVTLNGAALRSDDKGEPITDVPARPAYASGMLNLRIPPLSRTLHVEITPEATKLSPGATTAIDLIATDAAGKPVENAELALVVVDEAVLALSNYQLANPIDSFYSDRSSLVESVYARSSIVLVDPAALAAQMAATGGGGDTASAGMVMESAAMPAPAAAAPMATEVMAFDSMSAKMRTNGGPQATTPIAVRTNFDPLAIFAPATRTDANGYGRVEFTLPDNLTRYRVMVVAATAKQFGSAEANITARLPLMVRPSAPRFLNFGDNFELPVVLQNQTDAPMDVQVALAVSNLTLITDQETDALVAGKLVTIPANDRVEVRFPATTDQVGTARFQIAASAGDYADAANGELPVYTPATTEAFAVYGVVDEGSVAQPIAQPQDVFPQFGGLEISTSSTALSALTDALIYLQNYQFECSEQLSSRILGVAALRDVLKAFQAPGLPSESEIEKAMQRDIDRLAAMQNSDGGFPIWERGKPSVPFYSIHVTHALQRAKMKGYPVPAAMLQASLEHLRNIEAYYQPWYSDVTRRTLSAYALYVRDLMGDTDTTKARNLLNEKPLDEQSLEAIAWLWQVLSDDPASTKELDAIRRQINNKAVETAGVANFYTSYGDDEYVLLHSDRRTDALVLDALINDQPESDLIPKVVTGLLAHRTNGRWTNTQENVFVLLALDRYFATYENVTPNFVARMWLGETYVAEHQYQGYSDEMHQTTVPMQLLTDMNGMQNFIISKEGDGRLYYRLGLRYAPTDLDLKPLDMGFVVQRSYEAVDDPKDVQRDENGVWQVKAGARVRVRLSMVVDSVRYHVALVDPLPAGFEPINPALAVSQSVPDAPQAQPYGWWWYGPWYEHQNLRDSRAEAFTSYLWDGVYEYTYIARATTPGDYVAPPTKAEEMYMPEVFGRGGSDRVVIK